MANRKFATAAVIKTKTRTYNTCMEEKKIQTLTLEQQKKLNMTAVEEVKSFSDTRIVLVSMGKSVIISGTGLKIDNFSKTSGQFSMTGLITQIRFGGNLKRRIFG